MKNIIETLERYYHSFKDEQGGRNFFMGLADYVKYIIETPSLIQIVNSSILERYKKDTEEFKKLKEAKDQELKELLNTKEGKELEKEMIKMVRSIILTTKKMDIKEKEVLNLPLETIHDPMLFTENTLHKFIKKNKNIISHMVKLSPLMKSFYKKMLRLQTYQRYSREKYHQEHLSSEAAVWGSWDKLKLVYHLIHQRRSIEQEIENGKDFLGRVELMFLSGEMDMVLRGRPLLPFLRAFAKLFKFDIHKLESDNSWRIFTRDKYIIHLNRVHNYLIQELNKIDEMEVPKWFNHKNNSISFYGEVYKSRNEAQAQFVKQLVMNHQRENNNGTILKRGQRISENDLSNVINLSIGQVREIKKQLNRCFESKGFPLKIDTNTKGILLIHTI